MPKFILSPQHPVGFHRFSDCFFIFRLSGRIQSPYLFRLNVRDLLQLRRIRFRAVLCFSRAALLICSESDTSLNNYIKRQNECKDFIPSTGIRTPEPFLSVPAWMDFLPAFPGGGVHKPTVYCHPQNCRRRPTAYPGSSRG